MNVKREMRRAKVVLEEVSERRTSAFGHMDVGDHRIRELSTRGPRGVCPCVNLLKPICVTHVIYFSSNNPNPIDCGRTRSISQPATPSRSACCGFPAA